MINVRISFPYRSQQFYLIRAPVHVSLAENLHFMSLPEWQQWAISGP
jgi:hypothetical protein